MSKNDQNDVKRTSTSISNNANKTYMDFSCADKFISCIKYKTKSMQKTMSPTQIAFMKGKKKFEEEFNIFNLIKTIQKMKSAISLIMEQTHSNGKPLVEVGDIKDNYFKMIEIIIDDKEEEQMKDEKSEVMKFFDRDYQDIEMIINKIKKDKRHSINDQNLFHYIS